MHTSSLLIEEFFSLFKVQQQYEKVLSLSMLEERRKTLFYLMLSTQE
jgi:hypothetical protein